MASLNKVTLLGNLTRDPEIRYTPKGSAVVELGLALNRVWKDDQGQKQEETTFVDVTVWGKTAENCNQYLAKGRGVIIEGRLQIDQWDDKATGQKRSKLKVVAETVQFLPSGNQGDRRPDGRGQQSQQRQAPPQGQQRPAQADDDFDDDVPF